MSLSYAIDKNKVAHAFTTREERNAWVAQSSDRRAVPSCNPAVRLANSKDTLVTQHERSAPTPKTLLPMLTYDGNGTLKQAAIRTLYPYLNAATGEPAFADNAKEAATDGRIPLAPITVPIISGVERFLIDSQNWPSGQAL